MGPSSWVEHGRSLRPSTLLGVYLLFTVLLDIVRVRSIWLSSNTVVSSLFSEQLAIEATVLVLESLQKTPFPCDEKKMHSPEKTAGYLNQSSLWWLNRLIRTGFRQNLARKDLYSVKESMKNRQLVTKFEKASTNGTFLPIP